LSYGFDFSSDKRIPYMPVHSVGSNLSLFWSSGHVKLSGYFQQPVYNNTANTSGLERPLDISLAIAQRLGGHVELFASAHNLLNKSYFATSNYAMPGLSITLGAKANLW
jgi:vitamin B12 transporter